MLTYGYMKQIAERINKSNEVVKLKAAKDLPPIFTVSGHDIVTGKIFQPGDISVTADGPFAEWTFEHATDFKMTLQAKTIDALVRLLETSIALRS